MSSIEQLRQKIENIDHDIIKHLAQRQELSQQIGLLKSKEGKAIIDPAQEKKLFRLYGQWCEKYHLPQSFIKNLFRIIIDYSRMVQKP
ncbi:chorismate mutase [Legionella israelensis]|uniref:chorismate mutase n=1 Tax=Legionella israelensis TaxID=454 RepID=UPI00117BF9B3|nr:chorismate mutase [Legionella israelensis]QDP71953.1 chorismate mutase [Legionella israelensis]